MNHVKERKENIDPRRAANAAPLSPLWLRIMSTIVGRTVAQKNGQRYCASARSNGVAAESQVSEWPRPLANDIRVQINPLADNGKEEECISLFSFAA